MNGGPSCALRKQIWIMAGFARLNLCTYHYDLLMTKPDRVFSPKRGQGCCRYARGACCAANIHLSSDSVVHTYSLCGVGLDQLVRAGSAGDAALGYACQPTAILPGCQPTCQAVCWILGRTKIGVDLSTSKSVAAVMVSGPATLQTAKYCVKMEYWKKKKVPVWEKQQ